MSLALMTDHHIPDAVTDGLRERGVDVLTAFEDGAAELEDDDLLQRASILGRVLYSQDRDLLVLASEWQSSARPFSGVIYAHQMRITVGQAIRDLEILAQVYEPA
ncbi:MAG: DUF5615 family PIN-like protein [Pseudorhodoplanes sp.]